MWALLLAAALSSALLLRHVLWSLQYWRRRGVPHPQPLPLVGNSASLLLRRTDWVSFLRRLTRPFRQRGYCGFYNLYRPTLLVWDPEMVKQLVVGEFSSFHSRGMFVDVDGDHMSGIVFNLEGSRWRRLRRKMSPMITSGKLKHTFPLMQDVARGLGQAVRAIAGRSGGEVDLQLPTGRFAVDVSAAWAFGMECHSLKNEDDTLLEMSREGSPRSLGSVLRFVLYNSVHPKASRIVPLDLNFPKASRFFAGLMKDTIAFRESSGVTRKDFAQLLIDLRVSDCVEPDPEKRIDFTTDLMSAQPSLFLLNVIDSASHTVSFCATQLAFDPDLQSRAAEEVRVAMREHGGGQLTYEALQKLDLVERVILEGMRLWPAIGNLTRKCYRATKIGDLVIDEGQSVIICTDVMHMDPDVFPYPTRFDPDRFTEEAKRSRHPYAFLPFGGGPRICIAERWNMLIMKLALASLLNDFRFAPSPRTRKIPDFDPNVFAPAPKDGFWVLLEPRDD